MLMGLWHLHKKLHQVHRDLKPANILLNRLGEIKLTDFGTSKALESTAGLCSTFVGTTRYMSPERIAGGQYSFPSDVWSLGIILYELAAGESPFPPDLSVVSLYEHIANNPEPRLLPEDGFSAGLCNFVACWYDSKETRNISSLQRMPEDRTTVTDLIGHQWLLDNEMSKEAYQAWVLGMLGKEEPAPMKD